MVWRPIPKAGRLIPMAGPRYFQEEASMKFDARSREIKVLREPIKSVRSYEEDLTLFSRYLEDAQQGEADPSAVDSTRLRRYAAWLCSAGSCTRRSPTTWTPHW